MEYDMENFIHTTVRIHSFETGGTVDGPGIRFVVFTQGCPLRCQYCHNPDTWNPKGGREVSGKDVVSEILKYKSFMQFSKGGVTFSGGEPLLQKKALLPVFKALKKENVHIALDTAGTTNIDDATLALLDETDMVLLDVKHLYPTEHQKLTGLSNKHTFDFLDVLRQKNIRTWVRWVVVPNINDTQAYADEFADKIKQYPNVELVEILPYHQSGVFKWKELGIPYALTDTPEPSKELIQNLSVILENKGIKTLFSR